MKEKIQCQDPKESPHLLFVSISFWSLGEVLCIPRNLPWVFFSSPHLVVPREFHHHLLWLQPSCLWVRLPHMFISTQPQTETLTLVHPSWILPCACPTGICKPTGPKTDWDPPPLQICLPSYSLGVEDVSLPIPSSVSSASSVLSTCSVTALDQGPPPLARACLQASLFCSPSPILLLLPGGLF